MSVATRFADIIETEEQLRDVVGTPAGVAVRKAITHLDRHYQAFIQQSPFVLIGSSDEAGNQDVSPKGDPAGFVLVLDEHTLAIPDRPGNRRADTFVNILRNPQVALFFMVPGSSETLRVQGRASIVRDPELRERMAVKGKVPQLAIVVEVEEAFMHCARCIMRSDLWDPASWPAAEGIPSLTEAVIEQQQLPVTREQLPELEEQLRKGLY